MKKANRIRARLHQSRKDTMTWRGGGAAILSSLLLASCAVGPDFKKPAAPDVTDYVASPLSTTVATPDVVGGDAQQFVKAADISGDWWTLFHSQVLNDLVAQSLKNNPDL